ncbi:hypothetical protein WN51_11487 [Melipona quadrifasciata]|uniref:Uncharacterized protein n=1 Tax=Melipona quadrifasciata TaxID=166423 RepID=A0A0M9AAK6_9HYME|nr:hypothetical protein WN51_11487 [Melipona quadrifasciata]
MTIGHKKFGNRLIFFLDELAIKEGTNRGMENDAGIPRSLRGSKLTTGIEKGFDGEFFPTLRGLILSIDCATLYGLKLS